MSYSSDMTAPYWIDPNDNSCPFPDVELALREPDGLLAVGGNLSPERLVNAYRHGIFPWYSEGQPILWWSPNPRSVLVPANLKISRSLNKTLRKKLFNISIDKSFADVIRFCTQQTRPGQQGTWITPEMGQAYIRLHELGIAHSVESWFEGKLVGGLYGIALGRVFFGESMFSTMSDASKVAFVTLVEHIQQQGFKLIDCQMQTAHLDSLGAENITRSEFIQLLDQYCEETLDVNWNLDNENHA